MVTSRIWFTAAQKSELWERAAAQQLPRERKFCSAAVKLRSVPVNVGERRMC